MAEDRIAVRREPSSFRDPSGFIYHQDKVLLRQVNACYRTHYDQLLKSGLYKELTSRHLMVRHDEESLDRAATADAYKVLRPERIPVITYPYEWSFSQLKDAAATTLEVQLAALQRDMWLKDASAYNIQFHNGRPVLIDTLSLERYPEGRPWVAYRQFCQHFLATLALAAHRDLRLIRLLRVHIDGVPLDLASRLLPVRSWMSPGILAHIHLHAVSQKRYSDDGAIDKRRVARISRNGMIGLVEGLQRTVRNLRPRQVPTEWGDYYADTNYSDAAMRSKESIVLDMLAAIVPAPVTVLDLGANTGRFSRRIRDAHDCTVIAADIDELAVERNYDALKSQGETGIIPVILDLTNPPGGAGWANEERPAFFDRAPHDTVVALALIHHLAISNNLTLGQLAAFFARICRHLVVEFVPKSDSQVKRLLVSREDIFPDYDTEHFELEFAKRFVIQQRRNVADSQRSLYLMSTRNLA